MKLNKVLLALFAIFCVIVSAGAACTADLGGYAGSNYHDSNDLDDGNFYVPDGLEPGAGLALENQTADGPMNVTGNAVANQTNTGLNHHHTLGNATGNVTHSQTNVNHAQTLLATGNPIILLLVVFSCFRWLWIT